MIEQVPQAGDSRDESAGGLWASVPQHCYLTGKGGEGNCTKERLDSGEAPTKFSAIPWGALEPTGPCRDVQIGIRGQVFICSVTSRWIWAAQEMLSS